MAAAVVVAMAVAFPVVVMMTAVMGMGFEIIVTFAFVFCS